MPRPVDLDRILAVELEPGALAALQGMVDHEDRVFPPRTLSAPLAVPHRAERKQQQGEPEEAGEHRYA
jgi:hypothetical protein